MNTTEFIEVINSIKAVEEKEGIVDKSVDDAEIMIDCLDGDVFCIDKVLYNKKNNVLKIKLHRGDKRWMNMDMRYPIKLSCG